LLLIKNANLDYVKDFEGIKDILVESDRISTIQREIDEKQFSRHINISVHDLDGMKLIPGIVDQHIHINGAGADLSPFGKVSSVSAGEIFESGVTTVVGAPAIDLYSKPAKTRLQYAKALSTQGVNTYIYTGSFNLPSDSITDSVEDDLMLIEKVIGTKIALSEPLGAYPSLNELKKLFSVAYRSRLCSGKAAIIHAHMGHDPEPLEMVFQLFASSGFPKDIFIPTHSNCTPEVFEASKKLAREGGFFDVSSVVTKPLGSPEAIKPSVAISKAIEEGIDPGKITMSSDGNVLIKKPSDNSTTRREGLGTLLQEVKSLILDQEVSPEVAFSVVTENPAKYLKLFPRKGALRKGSDADLVALDKNFKANKVWVGGKQVVKEGKSLVDM